MIKINKEKQQGTIVTIYEFVAIWCGYIEPADIKQSRRNPRHHEHWLSMLYPCTITPSRADRENHLERLRKLNQTSTAMGTLRENEPKSDKAMLFAIHLLEQLISDRESGRFTHSNDDHFYRHFTNNQLLQIFSDDNSDGCAIFYGYTIGNLTDWVLDNYDIPDEFIPDWAKQLNEKTEQKTVDITELSTNSDYVKVSELSQIMQFMIECSFEPSYQHANINNKHVALKKFKSDTVDKIVELSVNKGLTQLQNKKLSSGISKTKSEYVFDFIQKKQTPLN